MQIWVCRQGVNNKIMGEFSFWESVSALQVKRHQEVEPGQLRPSRLQVCSLDLQTTRPKNQSSREISAPIGKSERDKSAAASGANLELKQLHLERINNSVGGKRESAASRFWRSNLKVVFQPCSVEGACKPQPKEEMFEEM